MLYLLLILLAVSVVHLLVAIFRKTKTDYDPEHIIQPLKSELDRLALSLRSDLSNNKTELNSQLSGIKTELNTLLSGMKTELTSLLTGIKTELNQSLLDNRSELNGSLNAFRQTLETRLNDFSTSLKSTSEGTLKQQEAIRMETEAKLEAIRNTVQQRLEQLQLTNTQKLDEMRLTVDEKLQQTLATRINESFQQVRDQLDKVHSGLGAMTSLANDVGGLKKVLSNVKTRGIIGEIQLEALLSSVLSPEQYEANVQIKKNTQEKVEFAIKLPGKDQDEQCVYLPIDSKFPDESYQRLLSAYDDADPVRIAAARKELFTSIRNSAKDIRDKYIDPPASTDWGILFLPFEGLYAEVLQNSELVHLLQNQFHITLAGPTTLGAFINSLQMGFRTLAIEKRSSEVWQLLGAVKSQFNLFGDVLNAAQKKIRGAGDDIEKLVGTRTRMIQSKLKQVETLPEHQQQPILELDDNGCEENPDEDK